MARPRVFVSSTYYDLKHLRSSLENFVESLGFDAILSEKGKIAYTPDLPLDESCYREVGAVDIFVLIVGGRYGSEISSSESPGAKTFYERYNSITRGEYRAAVDRDVPIYVLIERSVYAEYETYLKNKNNKGITYAHVDSVNIFGLIEDIISQPRNNPIQQFDKYGDIEVWLREQWAGLFKELLQRIQQQAQISSLQAQVAQMSELNTTLKRYLEEIVSRIAPKESERLIRTETKRLAEATIDRQVKGNPLLVYLTRSHLVPESTVRTALTEGQSFEDFVKRMMESLSGGPADKLRRSLLEEFREAALRDVNKARANLGLEAFVAESSDMTAGTPKARKVKTKTRRTKKASKRRNKLHQPASGKEGDASG